MSREAVSRPGEEGTAAGPAGALHAIAARLRADETLAAGEIVDPREPPALGLLAAAGPRGSRAPADYSFVVEAVREGYLLHYEGSRLLPGADEDLALLAGDYLYALGIERLAGLRDEDAVLELSDLISLGAQVHAEGRSDLAIPLWLAGACAVGCGASEPHNAAKRAVREADPGAESLLKESASRAAEAAGLGEELGRSAEAIESAVPRIS